mmetsp:Transcript_31449/g.78613  ORF Transcript_31449/g.78613 Transcript_31449/m.78613 type:complete len:145 (+) Transcript_31449:332-766(+)
MTQTGRPLIEGIDSADGRLRTAIDVAARGGNARELWTLCTQAEEAYAQRAGKGNVDVRWWWLSTPADAEIREVVDISAEQAPPVDLSGLGWVETTLVLEKTARLPTPSGRGAPTLAVSSASCLAPPRRLALWRSLPRGRPNQNE